MSKIIKAIGDVLEEVGLLIQLFVNEAAEKRSGKILLAILLLLLAFSK